MKNHLLIVTILCSLLVFGCSKEQKQSETQVQEQPKAQENAPAKQVTVPAFDAQNAWNILIKQTDFGPRTVGSKAHALCQQFIFTEMQKYADSVWFQPFTEQGYNNQRLSMNNILASVNPRAKKRILFLTHWDCRPWADMDKDPKNHNTPILGANDAASGVAVLIEMARAMKSAPPQIGIDFLFVDGEDYGKEGDAKYYLLGSRYFAKNLPPGYNPEFGILLDMVGDSQLELKRERFSMQYAPDIVDLVWNTAFSMGVMQFTNALETNLGSDDHIPLNEAGIKTIDIIDFAYPNSSVNYWHTTQDTPEHCSSESLDAVGRVLLQVIYTQNP